MSNQTSRKDGLREQSPSPNQRKKKKRCARQSRWHEPEERAATQERWTTQKPVSKVQKEIDKNPKNKKLKLLDLRINNTSLQNHSTSSRQRNKARWCYGASKIKAGGGTSRKDKTPDTRLQQENQAEGGSTTAEKLQSASFRLALQQKKKKRSATS